jgi:hypothetical protein
MRFNNETDYRRVVEIFNRVRLPIKPASGQAGTTAVVQPTRPASASVIEKSSVFDNYSSSYSRSMNTSKLPDENVSQSPSCALSRPTTMGDSPYFGMPHTASFDSVKPGSGWPLSSTNTPHTISSNSFTHPSTKPSDRFNAALDNVWPSQSGKEVRKDTFAMFLK